VDVRHGQARSKKVSAKPENEEGEEMAFLMEITRNTELLSAVDWSDFDDQAWKELLALLVKRIVVVCRSQYCIE